MLRKFFGLKQSNGPIKYVNVQVGRSNSHKVEFDDNDVIDVGLLRNKTIRLLRNNGKHLETVSLIFSGKKLSNDDALLVDCGISNGSKILVTIRRPQSKAAVQHAELTAHQKIQQILDSVTNDLEGKIHTFCQSPPKDSATREDEHRRLSELVLQNMFSLDNVDVAEDQEARAFRKQVINRFHGLHSNLDEANKKAETGDNGSIKSKTSQTSKKSQTSKASQTSKTSQESKTSNTSQGTKTSKSSKKKKNKSSK